MTAMNVAIRAKDRKRFKILRFVVCPPCSCVDERYRANRTRAPLASPPRVHTGAAMTPGAFIAKWRASELKESSAAHEHFIDLCRMLGEPTPAEADPTGESYCFERGARKDTGGDGWETW